MDLMAAVTHIPIQVRFDYAIRFLEFCEGSKIWRHNPGIYINTCGYTGPGIGLIIKLFEENGIYDDATLQAFLIRSGLSITNFVDIINETIGNFLDLFDENPVTETTQGVFGLIKDQIDTTHNPDAMDLPIEDLEVYKIDSEGSNLSVGVNVISFTSDYLDNVTFHHATIYFLPEEDTCFILDSWMNNYDRRCRPLTYRQFSFQEVKYALIRLNSDDILVEEAQHIFNTYFLAPESFIHLSIPMIYETASESMDEVDNPKTVFSLFTINPIFIETIYTACETNIRSGEQLESHFGGSLRKKRNTRRKKLRKKRKSIKSKKLRKMKKKIRTKNKY
jgi:hypothetical protein